MEKELINDIGIQDDLGKLSEEQYKESLVTERDMFIDKLKKEEETRERYNGQLERQAEQWEIMLKGYRTIEPKMEYEKSDRFWEIQLEEFKDKIEMEKVRIDGRQKQFDKDIETYKLNIQTTEDKISNL